MFIILFNYLFIIYFYVYKMNMHISPSASENTVTPPGDSGQQALLYLQ